MAMLSGYPGQTPLAVLLASFDSATTPPESTVILNSQFGSKQFGLVGIVKMSCTDAPGASAGVGCDGLP